MKIARVTPELPVPNLAKAHAYDRDRLGLRIKRTGAAGRIGAVAHGACAIFFRETDGDINPGWFRVFAEDVDAAHAALVARGAEIVEPVRDTEWGLRQVTLRDAYGNLFFLHHDL